MASRVTVPFAARLCIPLLSMGALAAHAQGAPAPAAATAGAVLKVCADPDSLPQSDKDGGGYENKLAEALAHDLGRRVEYTFFPQRMGFVRNTLRAKIENSSEFKCDVIMGVPKGYDLTATTQPYMHSTYALVIPARDEYKKLASAEELLKLPEAKLHALRIGIFAQTPATDWLLKNGLIGQARIYAAQSGDPSEHPANIIERDLAAGNIDLAIVWGPVAGFLTDRHNGGEPWLAVPFKPDPTIRFDYEISMGVRFGEKEWKDALDGWIAAHSEDIKRILVSYRVPLLDTSTTSASAQKPVNAR